MTEFIKICAAIGIFTMYIVATGLPGAACYHFLKHTTLDNPIDHEAITKSALVSYTIGLVAFVWVVVYFVIVRG